jgi:hypothetical protein
LDSAEKTARSSDRPRADDDLGFVIESVAANPEGPDDPVSVPARVIIRPGSDGSWQLVADSAGYDIPQVFGEKIDGEWQFTGGSTPIIHGHGSVWIVDGGPVLLGAAEVTGDASYPVLFKLLRDRGLCYLAGRGTVKLPDSPLRQLGELQNCKQMLDGIRSSVPFRREASAWALGWLPTTAKERKHARAALLTALGDTDVAVRQTAAESLGRVGDGRTLHELRNFSVWDLKVRPIVTEATARIRNRLATEGELPVWTQRMPARVLTDQERLALPLDPLLPVGFAPRTAALRLSLLGQASRGSPEEIKKQSRCDSR